MYFKQSDLFWGLDRDFVKAAIASSEKRKFEKGGTIFRAGEPASHFYILIKGNIRLRIGEAGPMVYIVSRAGEAFGWSSLLKDRQYSATALCSESTEVVQINGKDVQKVMSDNPSHGLVLSQRLVALIGDRLIQSYGIISDRSRAEEAPTLGTGQKLESIEMI